MLVLLSVLGCVKVPAPSLPSASPGSNVWLRSSFDADASPYVGRFVPQGARDLDEGAAMPLACSRFITSRFVPGGGVRYAEDFQASTQVGARLGVPTIVDAKGGGTGTKAFRVEYTLTGKLVAEVSDPEAFAACCKATPDQCSDRFIGEFLQGTGAVYNQAARSVEVGATAAYPAAKVGGDVSVANDSAWTRAIEFPNPVYFAFKVTQTPFTTQVSSCPSWVTAPPTTTDGLVLVGRSKAVKDDADARKAALKDAQRQLWQSIGAGPGDADGDMGAGLQAKEWCVETRVVDGQPRFVGNVLVTVPQVTIDAMRRGAAKREAATDAWMNGAGEAPRNAPRSVDATPAQADAGRAAAASAPAPGAGAVLAGAALSDTELAAVGARIDAASFSADKVQALLAGTQGRSLTAAQAANLLRRFAFSSDQLVALGHLASGIRNRQDAALVVEVFSFSADKARAQELLR
jgi:hypothetical protein